jgi:opacity protein-like surface antigen
MGSLKSLLLATAAVIGVTGAAAAADLGPPAHHPLPPPPVAAPIAEASGWYLRGDIGVGQINGKTEIEDRNLVGSVFPTKSRGHAEDFGGYAFGGVGVGYQVNSWFRGDLTAEYRSKASVSFNDKYCFNNVTGGFCSNPSVAGDVNGFNQISGRIGSALFLANAYVDLGTWHGLTPFIGAGVGFANHRMTGFKDVGGNFTSNGLGGGAGASTGGYLGNSNKTNFAWALMAGVGYDVNERLKLELGYRYLNMGKLTSGRSNCFGDPNCNFTVSVKEIDAHDFRLGMRWMLGGPSYAAAPVGHPVPVMKRF